MKYKFLTDPSEDMQRVQRDDGAIFEWPFGGTGHAWEQWVSDGKPLPEPYVAPVVDVPDDSDRRRRREASDVRAR